jgi:Uma2 family endonuclease
MLSSSTMVVSALNLPLVPEPAPDVDARVILHNVDFQTYSTLRDLLDGPSPRLTYLCGTLEIMSPSRRHEDLKKRIARLVELFALERNIPLYGYGSTTFRREAKQRGLEPDECYCVGGDMLEYPEIALEIVVTSGGINKLAVYREFGVREVWFWKDGRFELYALRGDGFHALTRSERVPSLDFDALVRFVLLPDQHQSLLEYRAFLRASDAT